MRSDLSGSVGMIVVLACAMHSGLPRGIGKSRSFVRGHRRWLKRAHDDVRGKRPTPWPPLKDHETRVPPLVSRRDATERLTHSHRLPLPGAAEYVSAS